MSLIFSAAETIATLVAAGYAATKIEDVMIRAKVLPHPLEDELGDIPPAIQEKIDVLRVPAWTEKDEREMIRLFEANPLAFWLDPARWGMPDRFDRPNAAAHKRTATAIRGHCERCGGELRYTKTTTLCTKCGDYRNDLPERITEQPDKTIQRARRDIAWEKRAAEVHAGRAENHGSCPGECGMPVDKRDGMYYCSDSQCHRSKKGWK